MNPDYNFESSSSCFHFLDLNEPLKPSHEQFGLIVSHAPKPHQQATASSSACPTFLSVTQDYRGGTHIKEYHQTQHKVDQKINVLVEGSSAGHVSTASSYRPMEETSATSYQPTEEDNVKPKDHMKMVDHERSTGTNGHGTMKWISSKLRVMRKVMPSNKSSETDLCTPAKSTINVQWNSNTAEIVRVCSDCNTTKTPLWRGGPQGPKSLCNACGIRRRKARKAMALAASDQIDNANNVNKMQYYSSAEAPKIHNTEKKPRNNYHVTESHQTAATSKLSFEDFAVNLINKKSNELFPQDEEEAAILLMALSCGLIPG